MKTKLLADFQICISVPLRETIFAVYLLSISGKIYIGNVFRMSIGCPHMILNEANKS